MIILMGGSVALTQTGEDAGHPNGQPGDADLLESFQDAPDGVLTQ